MKTLSVIRILWCSLVSCVVATAQLPVAIDPEIVETAQQQELIRLRADSLKRVSADMWRMSDSLRIDAMLVRIRSDSIRRTIGASDTIPEAARILARARIAEGLRDSGKVKVGLTLSDSLTLESLKLQPDTGMASYYASEFHGKKTSSGERYDMNALTCAHRWLPFGTTVRITNVANGKEVVVRVNDRGPFKHGRIVDVSKRAAQDLGMIAKGTARVTIQVTN